MDSEISVNEMAEWLLSLLKHFEMEHGYPSTHVITSDGPEHGVVGDELGAILEEGLGLLSVLRKELGEVEEEDDSEFDPAYEVEFEMDWGDDE